MAQQYLKLELGLGQPDPWNVRKTLTDFDVSNMARVIIPKIELEAEMGDDLIIGMDVSVEDVNREHPYSVTIKRGGNDSYYLGNGWTVIKNAKGLNKDDVIGLSWDKWNRKLDFKLLR
ncbi:unnamed protein product [Arabidopsis lyrata]|uniref:Uncharacterized protein n=1 Tax=Arabidopsis lyrata subsp. lyrata TaxID=81972 RepID=D7L080_ARALL|nr:B3 domain-containing protein At1g10455 [Arabidopsis lyrata subsp. lyrata]EFH60399.1 hypothetical protein ARALYDRAFT_900237 [Arabidopsis lyrata subsp. lyrata]CAH8262479.1 unnamed protein product [Arabidopsis lyrata]|eukprot:XP_002884140.1 B3 domain-containing protein At1g10455 [Arabidopsis lyrata subsp. lyrata]